MGISAISGTITIEMQIKPIRVQEYFLHILRSQRHQCFHLRSHVASLSFFCPLCVLSGSIHHHRSTNGFYQRFLGLPGCIPLVSFVFKRALLYFLSTGNFLLHKLFTMRFASFVAVVVAVCPTIFVTAAPSMIRRNAAADSDILVLSELFLP
jgi:hypothetical protein